MENSNSEKILSFVRKSTSFLAFGVVILYWIGYIFLIGYSHKYEINILLSDLTLQDILIVGVVPVLLLLMWGAIGLPVLIGLFFNPALEWISANPYLVLGLSFISIITFSLLVIELFHFLFWIFQKLKKHLTLKMILFFLITMLLFLWLPYYLASVPPDNYSPQVFTLQKNIYLIYKAPLISVDGAQDFCEKDTCSGYYRKIFETKEYLFLVRDLACENCVSFAFPKNRVLQMNYEPF